MGYPTDRNGEACSAFHTGEDRECNTGRLTAQTAEGFRCSNVHCAGRHKTEFMVCTVNDFCYARGSKQVLDTINGRAKKAAAEAACDVKVGCDDAGQPLFTYPPLPDPPDLSIPLSFRDDYGQVGRNGDVLMIDGLGNRSWTAQKAKTAPSFADIGELTEGHDVEVNVRANGVDNKARFTLVADPPMAAPAFLQRAIDEMKARAVVRDQPQGERAMARTVAIFNAIMGETYAEPITIAKSPEITELSGWLFMIALKLARARQGKFNADDYTDLAAYAALAGECAAREV